MFSCYELCRQWLNFGCLIFFKGQLEIAILCIELFAPSRLGRAPVSDLPIAASSGGGGDALTKALKDHVYGLWRMFWAWVLAKNAKLLSLAWNRRQGSCCFQVFPGDSLARTCTQHTAKVQ